MTNVSTEDRIDLRAVEKSGQKNALAMGLIGRKSGLFYAQMEIYLRDYKTLEFVIRRQLYSNLPDIEFSIDNMDLEDVIDILREAKRKLDNHWLSTQHPRREEIFARRPPSRKERKEEKKEKEKEKPAVRPPEKPVFRQPDKPAARPAETPVVRPPEKPVVRPEEKREKGSKKCGHYIGYLAGRPIDLPLPQECLDCPMVFDCTMKTSES